MVALAAEGMLFVLQYSNSLLVILTTGGRKNLKPGWMETLRRLFRGIVISTGAFFNCHLSTPQDDESVLLRSK